MAIGIISLLVDYADTYIHAAPKNFTPFVGSYEGNMDTIILVFALLYRTGLNFESVALFEFNLRHDL